MVDAISGSLNSASSTDTGIISGSSKFSEDFNTFLKLLTTQLQSQDPTSPMETGEFTTQLVQFASVEQQIKQSGLLEKIAANSNQTGLLEASGLVGKNVEVFGNIVKVTGDETSINKKLVYAHARDIQDTKITIYNSSNNVVYTEAGINKAGKHAFTWDGKDNNGNVVPAGSYTVKVEELSFGSDSYAPLATNLVAPVKEVLLIKDEIYVNFGDFSVPFDDVLAVSQPDSNNNT